MHGQGQEMGNQPLTKFMRGISRVLSSLFNLPKAVSPHMGGERGGTLITVVAPAGKVAAVTICNLGIC